MDIELARKLQDAGFPQEGGEHLMDHKNTKLPTLSELIEACGDRFTALWKLESGWQAKWMDGVLDFNSGPVDVYRGKGATPEEAVANLYLSLHGKKD